MSPPHVLVTGAGGFLGSRTTLELLRRGFTVTAFDLSLDQGRLPDHAEGLRRVEGDILDHALVADLVAAADRVVHFAAVAGVHEYMRRTREVLDVNLLGTRGLLEAAARDATPVVIASTSEAYGKNPTLLHEGADTWLGPTTNARWCYSVSKLAGEHYAWSWAREGLPVAAVRYFNVYGPTLDAPGQGRVISQFLGAIQDGRPLTLVDGGQAVRCFCHVRDAVRATVDLLLRIEAGSPLCGRPFNIGQPEPVTMADLADRMIRLSGHDAGVEVRPGREFFGEGFEDIDHRVPDVSALREALGFEAEVVLDDGLREVLDHWGLLADAPTPAPVPDIPVIRPYYDADADLLRAYRRALDAGRTTNAGPEVTALEAESAAWLGAPRALAVGSGAAGLEAVVLALGLTGRVVLPSFTYIATLNAFERAGHAPVFADVDPHTWTLDPDDVAHLLASHDDVAAVCAVNVYGTPPDLDRLDAICREHGVALVYDAAHAFGTEVAGARWDPRPVASVYSLHATKLLPSIEGGLVLTEDADLAEAVAAVRTHGLTPDPLDARLGFNGKMDELSAATARHGLARFDDTLARRRRYGARLTEALSTAGWTTQAVPDGVVPTWQNLCARVSGDPAAAIASLEAHGVGWRRYFHPPLHRLRRLAPTRPLPVTEALERDLICLPIHARMDETTLRRLEAAFTAAGRT